MNEEKTSMGADMEFYDRHCKPCFERLERAVERIEHSIIGNGKPGLATRLDRLEQASLAEIKSDVTKGKVLEFVQKNWIMIIMLAVVAINSLRSGKEIDINKVAEQVVKLQTLPAGDVN